MSAAVMTVTELAVCDSGVGMVVGLTTTEAGAGADVTGFVRALLMTSMGGSWTVEASGLGLSAD
jgi:hypothetical protein